MSFENFALCEALLRATRELGYSTPTPIQLRAIPAVLEGRDLLAAAQTGTGKTAAFALPLLERLHAAEPAPRGRRAPRALVLVPTRELAAQVAESFRELGRYLAQREICIFGGVSERPQIEALAGGTDIVIATPGRLLDLLQQRALDLSRIATVVLDEADRMLDMGFIRDIRRVLAALPARRQSLLFSATFSEEIRRLAAGFLRDAQTIEVAPRNAPAERVEHAIYHVEAGAKRRILSHLLRTQGWSQTLVFARTKHGANRLAQQLENDGLAVAAIHGNKSQGARTRALADFKANRIAVLVATDIAARGLDITELPQVVNFELPHVPEDYVHRIGRTGRASHAGRAFSLVAHEERERLRAIERLLGRALPKLDAPVVEGGASADGADRVARARIAEPANHAASAPARRPPPARHEPSRQWRFGPRRARGGSP